MRKSDEFFELARAGKFVKAVRTVAKATGDKMKGKAGTSKVKKVAKAAAVVATGAGIGAGIGLGKNPGRKARKGENLEGKVVYVRPRGMRVVKHYGVGLKDGKVLHRTNTSVKERRLRGKDGKKGVYKHQGAVNDTSTFRRDKDGKKNRQVYVDSETTLKGKKLEKVARSKIGTAGTYKTFDKNCETFVRAFSKKKARRRSQAKTALAGAALGGGAGAAGVGLMKYKALKAAGKVARKAL
jgi:hypothetical protein